MTKNNFDRIIITCEHGGAEIPEPYAHLFSDHQDLLSSYRGYDPGALEHAKSLARVFNAPLHFTTISRTLVDFNRSPDNWNELFTEVSGAFDEQTKQNILQEYYWPYRQPVEDQIRQWVEEDLNVLHLSIHSFTHVFKGVTRETDIGLLYDPERASEVSFCEAWRDALLAETKEFRVEMNKPYAGIDDGFTRYLRTLFPEDQYAGLELEFNRDFIIGERSSGWAKMQEVNVNALRVIV